MLNISLVFIVSTILISLLLCVSNGSLQLAGVPQKCENPHKDSCYAMLQLDIVEIIRQLIASDDPDASRTTPQLIQARGYPVGEMKVETDDGYINTMFRIRRSKFTKAGRRFGPKPPVLIMHGLLGASHDFLLNPGRNNLPYMLADAGYDVFLGNNRGTTYSQKHRKKNVKENDYWDFSWHEFGKYDLPAFIDRILSVTGRQKLFYVGYSQGTTQFFVNLATRPEYNDKIQFASLLAPVAFLGNCSNVLFRLLGTVSPLINSAFGIVNGDLGLPPWNDEQRYFACENTVTSQVLCAPILFAVGGFNSCEMNCTRIPLYVSHAPDHTAFKNLWHYIQLIGSGKFREFDTRPISDDTIGQPPKDYDWSNIKVNISLYSGGNDALADSKDSLRVEQKLIENGVLYDHHKLLYDHLDFLWGITIREKVYDKVIKEFRKFRKFRKVKKVKKMKKTKKTGRISKIFIKQ